MKYDDTISILFLFHNILIFVSQLSCEIKHFLSHIGPLKKHKKPEVSIVDGHLKKYNAEREKMFVEDLAALDKITEDKIIDEIRERLTNGESYSFIGDVLLSLNSNELPKVYPRSVSCRPITAS